LRRDIADGKRCAIIRFVALAGAGRQPGVLLAYRLARLYRPDSATSAKGWLEVDPVELRAADYGRLALISGLSLFLELLMIRWITSEIAVFAYFKNFVLVACFLDLGWVACCAGDGFTST